MADDFGDDDPTIIELGPDDAVTPVDVEACRLCGAVCVIDDFDLPSLEAFPDHCIRARDGHWWFCARFQETSRR